MKTRLFYILLFCCLNQLAFAQYEKRYVANIRGVNLKDESSGCALNHWKYGDVKCVISFTDDSEVTTSLSSKQHYVAFTKEPKSMVFKWRTDTRKTVPYKHGINSYGYYYFSEKYRSGLCSETIEGTMHVGIDDPIIIKSVYFVNGKGDSIKETRSYACARNAQNYYVDEDKIQVVMGVYTQNGKPGYLEIFDRNGNWTPIPNGLPNPRPGVDIESIVSFKYYQLAKYVDYGKPIQFRTRKTMIDDSESVCESEVKLYYYPLMNYNEKIFVQRPACKGGSPIIMIPTRGLSGNYVVTIKGVKDNNKMQGYNYRTEDLEIAKYFNDDHYIITNETPLANVLATNQPVFAEGMEYTLIIEHATAHDPNNPDTPKTKCFHRTSFYIPDVPAFKINNPHTLEGSKTDNAHNQVQIFKRGGEAKVFIEASGSPTSSVKIGAKTLHLGTPETIDGRQYYKGSDYIYLPAGEYNLQATSEYATQNVRGTCTSNPIPYTLKQPDAINFTIAAQTPATCDPACVGGITDDGSVTIKNVIGGIDAYTVSPGATHSHGVYTINGVQGKETSVSVQDAYGNSKTVTVHVGAKSKPTLTIDGIRAPSLSCADDGQVIISNPAGGMAPYSYSSGGDYDTNPTLSGFIAGEENLIYIKDALGCVSAIPVNIPSAGPAMAVNSITPTAVSCNGDHDGSCLLVMDHVKGTLSASSNHPLLTPDKINIDGHTITLSNLPAGVAYPLTVTDSYNGVSCDIEAGFTIPDVAAITLSAAVTPVSDKGTATGSIALTVAGGNDGTWHIALLNEHHQPLQSADPNIHAGNHEVIFGSLSGAAANGGKLYQIKATDSKGCIYADFDGDVFPVRVTEPTTALSLSASIARPVSCKGDTDAQIRLTAGGGWDGYRYSKNQTEWLNGNIFTGFGPGTYTFYVTDTYGGEASASITVTEPAVLQAIHDSTHHVLCHSGNTGWVRYRVSGGTYPYSFAAGHAHSISFRGNDTLLTVSGLTEGSYQFTIKDDRGCQTGPFPENITQPAALTIPVIKIIHTSCEQANGQMAAIANGGTAGGYNYMIQSADLSYRETTPKLAAGDTARFIQLPHGQYKVTVTDSHHCETVSALQTINAYTNPVITSANIVPVTCYGGTNGNVALTAQPGTAPLLRYSLTVAPSYQSNNATGIFSSLPAGAYQAHVSDTKGCRSGIAFPVIVGQPDDAIHIVVDSIFPVMGKGSATGRIQLRVKGGNAGLKDICLMGAGNTCTESRQERNDAPFFFERKVAGNYTVRTTDHKGCTYTTPILSVTEPDAKLGFTVTDKQDALCKAQTGHITVQAYGGWGDYRYKRATYTAYHSQNSFNNLYAGNYIITVQDKSGATYTETITLYEPKDSMLAKVVTLVQPTCGSNGKLLVDVSGGTAPYKMCVDDCVESVNIPMPQQITVSGKDAGTYLLQFTDQNACRFHLETELNDASYLKIADMEIGYPSGEGTADGSIKATVQGGTPPYVYRWKHRFGAALPATGATISGITAGHYQLNVSDNACTVSQQVYVPGANEGVFEIIALGHETAYLAANGFCRLTSSIGPLVSFELITPDNTKLSFPATASTPVFHTDNGTVYLKQLKGGNYFLSAVTATGNRVTVGFAIDHYQSFIFTKVTTVPVIAKGGATGSINIETSGGGGTNRFVWTNSAGNILPSVDSPGSSSIGQLPAGVYTVSATDRYNNTIRRNVEVKEPGNRLTVSIADHQNQQCKTYQDAYVLLKAEGGWGDYQFRHQDAPYFTNELLFPTLTVRQHRFYMTDKMGALDSITVNITEPDFLKASVGIVDSVNCHGAADGSITFAMSGGTAPYRFAALPADNVWTPGMVAGNLAKGYHTYIFTDSHQCTGQDTLRVYMPEPDPLIFGKVDVTHTTCHTDNGKMAVSMQGGTAPYRYRWFDFENEVAGTGDTITRLAQNGFYRLEVLDRNGCRQQLDQFINPSTAPSVNQMITTPVICHGDYSGTALVSSVTAAEPYAPYRFVWSNGDEGPSSNTFPQGLHYVSIVDTNRCTSVKYFDISQPDSIWIGLTSNKEPHCFGYNDAFLQVASKGGLGKHDYLWSSGHTTVLADQLTKGSYLLTVTDANGCTKKQGYTIGEPDRVMVDLGEDQVICPGNTYVLDGQDFVAHRWYTGKDTISAERYVTLTKESDYTLKVTDNRGCFGWDTIRLSIGSNALVADFLLTSETFPGEILTLFELSNMPLDSMRWEFNDTAFLKVPNDTGWDYVLKLQAQHTGIYNIDLLAYSGGCISRATRQVEVVGGEDREEKPVDLGYKDALIQSFVVYPNPNNGTFYTDIMLREPTAVKLTLFGIASGAKLHERKEYGLKEYSLSYQLSNLNTGVYVLILTAGDERKQVKIIIEH